MSGQEIDILLKVVRARVLGYAVGAEREYIAHREAGSRTSSLVAMSSALITALSLDAFGTDSAARIIANMMVGVGFLGGGMILKEPGHIRGLTTAAGMGEIAAVGMAVGSGRFGLGVLAGVLILLVFSAELLDWSWSGTRVPARQDAATRRGAATAGTTHTATSERQSRWNPSKLSARCVSRR